MQPSSTINVVPVIQDEAEDTKKSITDPTSSGLPSIFIKYYDLYLLNNLSIIYLIII